MDNEVRKYLKYAIFSPPAEVLVDNEDEMKVIIKCPNCGQPTPYGETRMCSGYLGCDNKLPSGKECYFGDLLPRVMYAKEHDYEAYCNGPMYLVENLEKINNRKKEC